MKQKINELIVDKDLTVGVAIMRQKTNDILSINGNVHLPMQSVYKFYSALALLNKLNKG